MSTLSTTSHGCSATPAGVVGLRVVVIALACSGGAVLVSLYLLGGACRYLAVLLGGVAATGLTLCDVRAGLGVFLLLAGLSPEFSMQAGATLDNLRVEDFLFPVILASWAMRCLTHRERPVFRTPLTAPMVAITFWGAAATLVGLLQGTVPHGSTALLRFLKYGEYYVIFLLVYNNVRSFSDARRFALLFTAAAVLTGLFSIARGSVAWRETGDEFARASGPAGENYNTLVGYLMQGLALTLVMALSSRGFAWRVTLGAAALAILAAVLYTQSREGYIMLAVTGIFLAGKQYRALLVAGLALWLAAPFVMPRWVNARVHDTVHQLRTAQTDDPGSNSMTARLYAWRYRWQGWFVNHPVEGNGIGSIPFTVDNQYLLTMVETGLIGLALFLWLLVSLWRALSRASRLFAGTFTGVLATGTLGALVSLLVQGWAAASFGTIRTMEPFWFLAGLTLGVLRLVPVDTRAPVRRVA